MTQRAKVMKGFLMVLVLLVFSLSVGAPNSGRGGHYQNRLQNYVPQITSLPAYSYSVEATEEGGDTLTYCGNMIFQPGDTVVGLISWSPQKTELEDNTVNGNVNDSNTTEGRTEND